MTTHTGGPPSTREQETAVPRTFFGYLRSFGPGLIIVMTWLGAGDIVEMSVAGGNYGYALMWVIVLAVAMRYVFVSLVAKYQLCNPHGEGVLDGLSRLHWLYAPMLMVSAIVMGHVYESYVTVGIGEAFVNLFGRGTVWGWAALWNGLALAIVFRPVYGHVERVFKGLLVLLTLSFVGTALWLGPSPSGILRGTLAFALPEQAGQFSPLLVTIGMLGAIGGSLLNLVYPYFLEDKGWTRPEHRRVQTYDFLLAMVVMIVLDLSVWTLGAELLHARGLQIATMDDLPRLLSEVLGRSGRTLFYLGIFTPAPVPIPPIATPRISPPTPTPTPPMSRPSRSPPPPTPTPPMAIPRIRSPAPKPMGASATPVNSRSTAIPAPMARPRRSAAPVRGKPTARPVTSPSAS